MRALPHLATALLLIATALSAADLGIGAWKFNAAASTYESSPGPRESTRIWQPAGEGKVRFVHATVAQDGSKATTEFVAGYDGKEYPVKGSSRYDTVVLKRVSDHVVEQVFRLRGEITVRATRTVSTDGKRMTIVATGSNPGGRAFRNVLVYDRQ